jgi:hypothetical protein
VGYYLPRPSGFLVVYSSQIEVICEERSDAGTAGVDRHDLQARHCTKCLERDSEVNEGWVRPTLVL